METTSIIAMSRQLILRRRMEVIANNLANVNTAGFKGFAPLIIEDNVNIPSAGKLPEATRKMSVALDNGLMRDVRPGGITQTTNRFDVALQSEGYFAVNNGEKNFYTRNGQFKMSTTGQLLDGNGYIVQGDGGAINIPPGSQQVLISKDGTIATETGVVGKIAVVKFANEQDMKPIGGNLLDTAQEVIPVVDRHVVQGAIENSNVQSVTEMSEMIDVLRQYQSAQKLLETEGERQRNTIRSLAKLS